MRIAFDAKRLFHNFTGLGNYSRNLLRALLAYHPEHEYLLCTPRASQHPELTPILAAPQVRTLLPEGGFAKALPSLWRIGSAAAQARRAGADLYHGLSNEIPFGVGRHLPSTVFIHDVIFERHPDYFPWIDRQIYRAKFRYAARQADVLVCNAHFVRQEIEHFYGPRPDIRVIPALADPIYYAQPDAAQVAALRQRHALPQDYLLTVGSITPRKNLLGLVQAMQPLWPAAPPLVVVGQGKAYKQQVQTYLAERGLGAHVRFLSGVPLAELPALYHGALLALYPSFAEGFGMPILEAMLQGTPVVTSEGGCFPETGGDAALYADPARPEHLREQIARALGDSALRQQMRQRGLAHAERFHPRHCAAAWMQVYESLRR